MEVQHIVGWVFVIVGLSMAGGPARAADIEITSGTYEITPVDSVAGKSIDVDNALGQAATLQVDGGVTLDNVLTLGNGGTLDNAGTISRSGVGNSAIRVGAGGRGSGVVVNQNGGIIESLGPAIVFFHGGSVTNSGTGSLISSSTGRAISMQGAPGTVINEDGASISAVSGVGVYLDSGGTVTNGQNSSISGTQGIYANWSTSSAIDITNSGVITGTVLSGVDVENVGTVTNEAGGAIHGVTNGVYMDTAGGTLTNTGQGSLIDGSDPNWGTGVFFADTGTLINKNGATLHGTLDGAYFYNGGSVTNTGGATIAGDADAGITIWQGGTVVNSGKGSAISGYTGIYLTADPGSPILGPNVLTNEHRASIEGTDTGVNMSGGTLTNESGAKISGGSYGVFISGVDLTNNGRGTRIDGTGASAIGLAADAGGSVTNSNRAVIEGGLDGVRIDSTVSLLNQSGATITGGTDMGVISFDGGAVTNTGTGSTITGALYAVDLQGGAGTMINDNGGVVRGGIVGVFMDEGGTITNGVGSTISGSSDAIYAYGGTNLSNAGRLTGYVDLGDDANQVTLYTGSTISGSFNIGSNAASTLTLDGSGTQLYSDAVAGDTTFDGDLIKQGDGTWELDKALVAKVTTIEAGGLIVGVGGVGTLTSEVDVASGGMLGGSGTIIGNVISDGLVSPGNSPGTLTIDGSYQQHAGAIYLAQIDPDNVVSDVIDVSGTGTLTPGAMLDVSRTSPDPYVVGTRYTVLHTGTGLTGTFDLTGDVQPTAFLQISAVYDQDNAYLLVSQDRPLGAAADTPNESAVANSAQSLPSTNSLRTALVNLTTDAAARHAFNQLSGEIHSSLANQMLDDSHFVRDAAFDRLRDAFCGGPDSRIQADGTSQGGTGPGSCQANPDRLTVWGHAFGSWGHVGGDGNAASSSRSIGGFIGGIDAPVFDTWRAGMLAGYSQSSLAINGRASSATSHDYTTGLYGGTQWNALSLRLGAAYTWHDIDTDRDIAIPDVAPGRSSASYHAGTAQAFGELGYRLNLAALNFEPFANLAYVNQQAGGLREEGGLADLSALSRNQSATFSTLGLHAASTFDLAGFPVTANATLGWRHAFGAVDPATALAFSGGSSFDVHGVPIARDAAVGNAGLDFQIAKDTTFSLSDSTQLAKKAVDQSVNAILQTRF